MAPTIMLWKDIYNISDLVCKEYNLSYGVIVPETRRRTTSHGECSACYRCSNAEHIDERNCKEMTLYVRIHQLNRPNTALAASTILRTLAHELAHLKGWDHGKKHSAFEAEIVGYIKELGYEI